MQSCCCGYWDKLLWGQRECSGGSLRLLCFWSLFYLLLGLGLPYLEVLFLHFVVLKGKLLQLSLEVLARVTHVDVIVGWLALHVSSERPNLQPQGTILLLNTFPALHDLLYEHLLLSGQWFHFFTLVLTLWSLLISWCSQTFFCLCWFKGEFCGNCLDGLFLGLLDFRVGLCVLSILAGFRCLHLGINWICLCLHRKVH